MKRIIAIMVIALLLTACGATPPVTPPDTPPVIPPDTPPAIVSNTVDFSCLSVDNDTTCTGIQYQAGIWNSGPVQTTGSPMPVDFLNVEITNNSLINTSVFAYTLFTIAGCADEPIAFNAVDLIPGEMAGFSYSTDNVRCGSLGDQNASISLYNASGFNPDDYASPALYPRTELISNAVIVWDNRIPGDMP
jgi:predicted small lipoprotein YifL